MRDTRSLTVTRAVLLIGAAVLAVVVLAQVPTGPRGPNAPRRPGVGRGTAATTGPALYKFEVRLRGETVDSLSRKLPRTQPVYECSADMQTGRRMCTQLRERMDIGAELRADEDGWLTASADERHVELIPASGAVFAGDMSRLWRELPDPERRASTPGPDALQRAGLDFLGEIEAPVNGEYEATVYESEVILTDEGRETKLPGQSHLSVRPRVSGLPVVGPGGKLKVYFDLSGEVAGCLVVRRALSEVSGDARLLPLTAAIRGMAEGEAVSHLTLSPPRRFVIREISLGYYAQGAGQAQRFLQPVYVFRGSVFGETDGERWAADYTGYLNALREPRESIWPDEPGDPPSLTMTPRGEAPKPETTEDDR